MTGSWYVAEAGELRANSSVSGSAIFREVSTDSSVSGDSSVYRVNPNVNISYRSAKFQGRASANVTYLERDDFRENSSSEDTYTNFNYQASYSAIDNVLRIQANGGFSYRNLTPENYIVTDVINDDSNLVKTRNNSLAAILTKRKGDYFLGNGVARVSKVETGPRGQNRQGFDNTDISFQGTARNTEDADIFFWELSGAYRETDRGNQGNPVTLSSNDFITRRGDFAGELMVYKEFGIYIAASHDAYQYQSATSTGTTKREFYSAGAGLTYRQSRNRYIRVAYSRQFDSDIDVEIANDEDINDDTYFLEGEINWAATPRTSLRARLTRNATGETGNVSIRYNTKKLRSSLQYTENVTNFSRLINEPDSMGVFVCQQGSTSLADCFQPASLDYQLQTGETFLEFFSPNLELTDEVIKRQSLNAEFGLSGKRTRVVLNTRYSLDTYVTNNRQTRTRSVSTRINHRLGRRNTISASISYALIERNEVASIGDDTENETWNSSISYTRNIGRSLRLNTSLNYIERAGENSFINFGDFKERRVTIGITYIFNSRSDSAEGQGGITETQNNSGFNNINTQSNRF
ncbi:hypothetical protein [Alteromonas sp. H39]|uniref:hypothetical protein n=1 Tax=Alteromonas sp. H39 TaxID=3389876 RepID=UPI0039E0E4C3